MVLRRLIERNDASLIIHWLQVESWEVDWHFLKVTAGILSIIETFIFFYQTLARFSNYNLEMEL